mgnify:FL=1
MLLDFVIQLSKIVLLLFIIFGTFGNIFNLLIFTRPALLRSACTLYFIAASIDNLLALYTAVLLRLMTDAFAIDIGSISNPLCKVRVYVGYIALSLSPYCFILACFDRYCSSSTSVQLRSWSNRKTAKKCILGAIIASLVLYSHIPVGFKLEKLGPAIVCYPQSGVYNFFWRISYIVIYCFAPCICMAVLCLLTIFNIRRQSKQIQPTSMSTTTSAAMSTAVRLSRTHRRIDRNLVQMLFTQVLSQLLFILPFAIVSLAELFVDTTTQAFIVSKRFFTIPLFASYATSFYLYTMSSPVYRKEFLSIVSCVKQTYERGRTVASSLSMCNS